MQCSVLWIRLGDAADYVCFDDLKEVAKYMASQSVFGPIWRHCNYGVACQGYEGQNYISLYWGNIEACPTRSLSTLERQSLNCLLEKERELKEKP